jgi:hypothetical protein
MRFAHLIPQEWVCVDIYWAGLAFLNAVTYIKSRQGW